MPHTYFLLENHYHLEFESGDGDLQLEATGADFAFPLTPSITVSLMSDLFGGRHNLVMDSYDSFGASCIAVLGSGTTGVIVDTFGGPCVPRRLPGA
jgi:hypothetical protein